MSELKGKKDEQKNIEGDRIDAESITDNEIEEWIMTSIGVLKVLKQENQDVFTKVYQDFIFDLQRLKNTKRITDDDYDETLESI